jgi:HEAT repeat protein
MTETEDIAALIGALGGDDRESFDRARTRLVNVGEPAVAPLLAALETSKPFVRDTICRILGRMGPRARAAVPTLIGTLHQDDPDTAASAAIALGQIGDAQAVPDLIDGLKDSNFICTMSAIALGRIGDRRAVGPLIAVLADGDKFWVPRGGAAVALGSMGEIAREALPALKEALGYDCENSGEKWDQRSREAVEDAIRRIEHPGSETGLRGRGYRYEMWGVY